MLKYIPYVLMFAVATMIIYGWGLWRTMHQKQDLSNMLCSKGISKVKKALKKNKSLTKKELEPFVKDLTAKLRILYFLTGKINHLSHKLLDVF